MRDIRKNKKINIHKNNPALIGRFKQRTNATLILDLYDEFSNYVDLTNQEISIRVERPDGLHFEQVNNITKSSNILTVKLKNEVLEVVGKCRVELNLKDSEGQMNTADFFFEVVESVLSDDIVFSSEDYESLEKALVVFRTESNSLMKKLDDNEKVRISNENTRKSQETSRVNAENNRVSKENERINQENTRKNQEETRKSNETTRQNQERVRQESENTRKSQETNRVNKENERKTNEDTRKTNESDRQTRFTKLESDGRKLIAEMNTAIDGTITREVTEARGNKSKLGLRLNDMEQQSVENTNRIEQLEDLTPVWQEQVGAGFVTVNDSFDGVSKDLVVKGRTLKNLASKSDFELGILSWSTGQVAANNSFKRSSDFIAIDGEKVISNIPIHIFEYDNDKIFINSNPNSKKTELALNSNTRFIKICLDIASGDLSTIDLMLIVDNDLPSTYFDSITSTGEQEDNKIKIKSIGKNLFNGTYLNKMVNEITGAITNATGGNVCSDYILISDSYKSLTYQTFANTNYLKIAFYDNSKTFISCKYSSGNSQKITEQNIPDNAKYAVVGCNYIEGKPSDLTTLIGQLEEGSVATNYEQYRSKLIEIHLPFAKGLKNLPNGTYDEVKEGETIQRVGVKILDGTENWVVGSWNNSNITSFDLKNLSNMKSNHSINNRICDKFLCLPRTSVSSDISMITECITGAENTIYLAINKSRLETQSVEGLKKWLQRNPTTLYYELNEPIVHRLNQDINLSTFDTTTHIIQENNILSDISFKAKVSLSSQAKRLKEENRILKQENVSLKESSIKTTEEQEVQDQKITTTMLANTELFEMMLNFMPMQLDSNQFRGGN